jgi:hypothetical protein
MFTIEFFRIRKEDNVHAMLDRVKHIASDLESAKVKAKSLFDTLNMPQNPDGLGILDQRACPQNFRFSPETGHIVALRRTKASGLSPSFRLFDALRP